MALNLWRRRYARIHMAGCMAPVVGIVVKESRRDGGEWVDGKKEVEEEEREGEWEKIKSREKRSRMRE